MKKARISLDVMITDKGKIYIGNNGVMSPVPDTAFSVISELEICVEEALQTKEKGELIGKSYSRKVGDNTVLFAIMGFKNTEPGKETFIVHGQELGSFGGTGYTEELNFEEVKNYLDGNQS